MSPSRLGIDALLALDIMGDWNLVPGCPDVVSARSMARATSNVNVCKVA